MRFSGVWVRLSFLAPCCSSKGFELSFKEWIGDVSVEASMVRTSATKRRGEDSSFSSSKKARTSPDFSREDNVEENPQVFAEISGYYDEDKEATYGEVSDLPSACSIQRYQTSCPKTRGPLPTLVIVIVFLSPTE